MEGSIVLYNNEDYLPTIANLENIELGRTIKSFTAEVAWATEVFFLIKSFQSETKESHGQAWRISINLSHITTKEIHLAFLSIGRRHNSQAFTSMRSAVEAAGFINAIRNDKEHGSI